MHCQMCVHKSGWCLCSLIQWSWTRVPCSYGTAMVLAFALWNCSESFKLRPNMQRQSGHQTTRDDRYTGGRALSTVTLCPLAKQHAATFIQSGTMLCGWNAYVTCHKLVKAQSSRRPQALSILLGLCDSLQMQWQTTEQSLKPTI